MADKEQRGTKTYAAKHEEEAIADAGHVAKEERSLHETRHIWSCIVVVQAVAVDEQTSWSTTQKRPKKTYITIPSGREKLNKGL